MKRSKFTGEQILATAVARMVGRAKEPVKVAVSELP